MYRAFVERVRKYAAVADVDGSAFPLAKQFFIADWHVVPIYGARPIHEASVTAASECLNHVRDAFIKANGITSRPGIRRNEIQQEQDEFAESCVISTGAATITNDRSYQVQSVQSGRGRENDNLINQ